jgi:ribulose-phosphate 3-epimerase
MNSDAGVKIAPSILSADFARLGEQVAETCKAGADYIHVDVMDGHFVPQITIGAPVVAAIRKWSTLPMDVHLMVENPEQQVEQFIKAGASILTVHSETTPHIHRVIHIIKEAGVKAGVSINPATPISVLDEILAEIDLVLVMSVNPGFAGQTFIESTVGKINRLRKIIDDGKLKVEIEVDGGINTGTAPRVVKAGASMLVAGAAIFSSGKSIAESINDLRLSLR